MPKTTANASLVELSNQLAGAVAQAAQSVVAVHARSRIASTGVHWRDGLIVTTDATVRRDEGITITLPDGRYVPATIQGRDASSDLAVLRITDVELPPAELGDVAGLAPGHIVLALARLDESGPRASFGVVSSVGGAWRSWKGAEYERSIRSEVTLHPGFGGGPLIDAAGRVLGINSGGLSRGLATTIPAQSVERIFGHLASTGYVPRSWLGVAMQPVQLSSQLRDSLAIEQESGLLIIGMEQDGPAAKSGLLVGDTIIAVDGHVVSDPQDVASAIGGESVGRTLGFDVVRGGARAKVDVTIGERPRGAGRSHRGRR
ncbi:MAG: trypsin-like peptidase domain-containing protein [bacterium]